MRLIHKTARSAALFMALLLCLGALISCASEPFTVAVLAVGEGDCTVENGLITVPWGGSAVFTLSMPEGETVIQVLMDGEPTDAYSLKDGVLTLPGIKAPHTLRIVSGDPKTETYYGCETANKEGGYLETNMNQGRIKKGSLVTFRATPKEGAVFTGWSSRKPLYSGGPLISREEQFTMKITENTFLYANYDVSKVELPTDKKDSERLALGKNTVMIYYNANGGIAAGGKAAVEDTFENYYWHMPNALPDDGTFTKDGYVLLGYSSMPDGSTGIVPPSHKFQLDADAGKRVTMYCIWQEAAKASDFRVSDTSGGVKIDGYTGTERVVYIPRKINGKTVVTIGAGSFSGSAVEEVIIPSCVQTVEKNAFESCASLSKVTIYDSIKKIYDASFTGSPVSTLRICGATPPKYATGQNFAMKYERLLLTRGENRVVVVAGSSKFYGLDSDYLEQLLGGNLTVVNFGTNAMMNILFFLEAVVHDITESDYLLYTPEQYGPYAECTNGNPFFAASTFQGIESCYNMMEQVDLRHYENVFGSFTEYCATRANMKGQNYTMYPGSTDKYGDLTSSSRSLNVDSYKYGANGDFRFDASVIPEAFRGNMNRVLDKAAETGATVLFSHPPMNKNNILKSSLDDAHYDGYMDFLRETVHAALISDVRNYIIEGKYFFNTDYHLNEIGREMHTKQLAEDLLAAGIR